MARPIDDMSYMIWPFIYEALLPRLLTLTLCRQVMMIIINQDGWHISALDARGDRTTAEEKSSPHSKSLKISIILEIDDHPTLGKWPDWPK